MTCLLLPSLRGDSDPGESGCSDEKELTGANANSGADQAQGGTLFLDEVNTISPSTRSNCSRFAGAYFSTGRRKLPIKQMSASSLHPTQTSVLSVRGSSEDAIASLGVSDHCLRFRNAPDIPKIIDSLIDGQPALFQDIRDDPFVIKGSSNTIGPVMYVNWKISSNGPTSWNKQGSSRKISPNPDSGRTHRRGFARCQTPLEVRRQSLEQVERQYLKVLMMHQAGQSCGKTAGSPPASSNC